MKKLFAIVIVILLTGCVFTTRMVPQDNGVSGEASSSESKNWEIGMVPVIDPIGYEEAKAKTAKVEAESKAIMEAVARDTDVSVDRRDATGRIERFATGAAAPLQASTQAQNQYGYGSGYGGDWYARGAAMFAASNPNQPVQVIPPPAGTVPVSPQSVVATASTVEEPATKREVEDLRKFVSELDQTNAVLFDEVGKLKAGQGVQR